MAILSFALTKDEFLSGKKTVTRRSWKMSYFELWQRFFDTGNLIHDAYDRSPRAGGKPIGKFRLTCRPYMELLRNMQIEDLEAEGGMCKTVEEYCRLIGKKPDDFVVVIMFEKL